MANPSVTRRCISAEEHTITDRIAHYFGCVRVKERKNYYDELKEESKAQVRSELERIDRLRKALERSDDKILVQDFTNSLGEWKTELQTGPMAEAYGEVKKWNEGKRSQDEDQLYFDPTTGNNGDGKRISDENYNPNLDVNAYVIQFKRSEPVQNHSRFQGTPLSRKIPVAELLDEQQQFFEAEGKGNEDGIQYIHLPANNMAARILI